jgi:Xaa-Pro aminopeptidase
VFLKAIKPNVKEYELEAELTYQVKNGATRHAFKPIVVSGKMPVLCIIILMMRFVKMKTWF